MGRLIDVDAVKKRYPIMENDFGMVINDRLHKNLDEIPTAEAIPKDQYEARLKADMVAMLKETREEIEYCSLRYNLAREQGCQGQVVWSEYLYKQGDVLAILDKKIAKLEAADDT